MRRRHMASDARYGVCWAMDTTSTLPANPTDRTEDAHTTLRTSACRAPVELITRGERRRVWTEEQKREIVAQSIGPALTPTEVARKYAISTGLLYGLAPEDPGQADG